MNTRFALVAVSSLALLAFIGLLIATSDPAAPNMHYVGGALVSFVIAMLGLHPATASQQWAAAKDTFLTKLQTVLFYLMLSGLLIGIGDLAYAAYYALSGYAAADVMQRLGSGLWSACGPIAYLYFTFFHRRFFPVKEGA